MPRGKDPAVLCIQGRTSESTAETLVGARILAEAASDALSIDPIVVGAPGDFVQRGWQEDITFSCTVLAEARQAAREFRPRLVTGGHCAIALAVALDLAHMHYADLLWLDAHPDFHTPSTTQSQFLGGMILAGVVGRWQALTLARLPGPPLDPRRVVLAGVSDAEHDELRELNRAGIEPLFHDDFGTMSILNRASDRPLVIHLDLDVLDARVVPAEYPSDSQVQPADLAELLRAVCSARDVRAVEIVGWNGSSHAKAQILSAVRPAINWAQMMPGDVPPAEQWG